MLRLPALDSCVGRFLRGCAGRKGHFGIEGEGGEGDAGDGL